MKLFRSVARPVTPFVYLVSVLRSSSDSVLAFGSSPSFLSKKSSYSTYATFSQELIDQYDAFILDQFGVLHNGSHALDGAIELVEYLAKKCHKKLIILSNTSAPSDKAMLKLPRLGFDAKHFAGGAVTSGEEAARYIRATYPNPAQTKALMLTWDVSDLNNPRLTALPQAFLDHCGGLKVAATVEEADFLLLHGSECWYRGETAATQPLGSYIETGSMEEVIEPLLQQCAERNLPAVCANPDIIVQTPLGGSHYMPGKIAHRYQEMLQDTDTSVRLFGKPEPEHFQACLRALDASPERVAHVGDSLHHDILGANAAGIDNIFVPSGIHLPQLADTEFGELPGPALLDDLFAQEGGIVPTHVVPAFRL